MSIKQTSRTGKTYYLHEQLSAAGTRRYFFSTDPDGQRASAIPEGYEVYENVGGQVFLRKIPPQIVRAEELDLVKATLRQHGEPWRYQTELKRNTITVYEAGDMSGLDRLARDWGQSPLSEDYKRKFAAYMAVMRFALVDKTSRAFVTERFCFRGSIDDWIHVGGPGALAAQVRKFVKHLGRESFYELF